MRMRASRGFRVSIPEGYLYGTCKGILAVALGVGTQSMFCDDTSYDIAIAQNSLGTVTCNLGMILLMV